MAALLNVLIEVGGKFSSPVEWIQHLEDVHLAELRVAASCHQRECSMMVLIDDENVDRHLLCIGGNGSRAKAGMPSVRS